MSFAWDSAKNAANIEKHGVSFEAVDGFEWEVALVRGDLRNEEARLTALAPIGDSLHHLTFTIETRAVRVISLRRASKKELKRYEAEFDLPD